MDNMQIVETTYSQVLIWELFLALSDMESKPGIKWNLINVKVKEIVKFNFKLTLMLSFDVLCYKDK